MVTPIAAPEERVTRGAALLDERRPNWFKDVNLETLDVRSDTLCVLGQLYEAYSDGVDELELHGTYRDDPRPETSDAAFGFDIIYYMVDGPETFTRLTHAWVAEVTRRRAADRELVAAE